MKTVTPTTIHPETWNILTNILPLAILTHLALTHTTSHHFSQNLSPRQQLESAAVHAACIVCQLCSLAYHALNGSVSPRAARALYCLDLSGVCCMSFGSPWLYATGIGTEYSGLYTGTLFACTAWCLFLLAEAAVLDQETARAERWILVLSAIGNFPALARPSTAVATATILAGYIVFYRLQFPSPVIGHALWHCAVFAGQLGFIAASSYTAP